MEEKTALSDQHIIDCLNTYFGLEVTLLLLLPWGADINAFVYKAQTKNAAYFVKLKRGHDHQIAASLTRWLYDAGISQIIAPILTTQGQSTLHINHWTLIVYPFIEGQDGFNQDLTHTQWVTLGKAIRKIHDMNIPLSIQQQIRKEQYSPQWREAVRALYTHIDNGLTGDQTAVNLLMFMQAHKDIILQLVEGAEALSHKMLKQDRKLALCHSDIHGGNVLIANKNKLYIVDWDEPIMAPIERDLMFIGGGVANVWNKPHEEDFFYQGYGKVDINKTCLAYYRYERIVEDIAQYGHELLLMAQGGEQRKIMYQHFMDMFEPNGVVEIALRTNI